MCLRKVRSDAVDLLVVVHATCAVEVGNSFWAQRDPLLPDPNGSTHDVQREAAAIAHPQAPGPTDLRLNPPVAAIGLQPLRPGVAINFSSIGWLHLRSPRC